MNWDNWLKGRRWRDELGERVDPKIIHRKRSSGDRSLRKLVKGCGGLPFKPTEKNLIPTGRCNA